jgi:PTS system mannose-specific IIC component
MSMDVGALELLWLVLLGGWVAADGTSFGQFMVSRPLVAATLAGFVVGDPVAGAAVGIMLEAFHLSILPVGAARYPEAGPPAVAAGAVYAAGPEAPSRLLLAVAFALAWEWVGGSTIHQMRQFNVRFVAARLADDAGELERRHLAAIAVDFARGAGLVALGLVALSAVVALLAPLWGLDERITGVLATAILIGLLASSFRLFGGRVPWFVAGMVGGGAIVLIAT